MKYSCLPALLPLIPEKSYFKKKEWGFPGGSLVKNLPDNAGDTGSIPDPGGSHMMSSN